MAIIIKSILLFFFLISLEVSNACKVNSTHKHQHHNYFEPTSQRTIVVDARGAGDFLSVQDAVDSIPDNNSVYVILKIKAGLYIEKVVVPASKPYVTFQGAGRDSTVIQWHDRASDKGPNGQQLRTYNTASVTVFASHFTARNITFKNTAPAPMPGMQGWQAASFRISGDKAYFFGCGFYGAQDTLCDDAGRHYFKNCYIEGSIDFIFGNGRSMYKGCELHSIAERFGSIAAQARNSPCEQSGFAFVKLILLMLLLKEAGMTGIIIAIETRKKILTLDHIDVGDLEQRRCMALHGRGSWIIRLHGLFLLRVLLMEDIGFLQMHDVAYTIQDSFIPTSFTYFLEYQDGKM